MPKRSRKPADLNRLASSIVDEATGETEETETPETPAHTNGRKGGLTGGAARAAKLSPQRRSEIAQKAAQARWGGG